MQKFSIQTSSFIVLATTCIVGGFLVIAVSSQMIKHSFAPDAQIRRSVAPQNQNNSIVPTAMASEVLALPDTKYWPSFQSPVYGIKFKIPPTWKVNQAKKQGAFNVIEIDPGPKFYNVKLYISSSEYYVLEGLPAKTETIGGQPAVNVSNFLYGISANGYYFTFDVGTSLSLATDFNAMVKSVEFE